MNPNNSLFSRDKKFVLIQVWTMIKNIQRIFKEMLTTEISWMDEKMKQTALSKLENMITIMGYPNFITNPDYVDDFYKNLDIFYWDHYGNAQRLRAFKFAYQLSTLSHRDRAL